MSIQFELGPAIIGSVVYLLYRLLCVRIAPARVARDEWSDEREVPVSTERQTATDAKKIDPEALDSESNHIPGGFTDEPCAEPCPEARHADLDDHTATAQSSKHRFIVFAGIVVLLTALAFFGFSSDANRITSSPAVSDCEVEEITLTPIALTDTSDQVKVDVDTVATSDTVTETVELESRMWPPPPEEFQSQEAAFQTARADMEPDDYMEDVSGGNDAPLTLPLTRQEMHTTLANGALHQKSAYWGTLHVGMPSVPYKVVFDTGSGFLILPSAYCNTETCKRHKRYRRSQSNAAKDINQDGSVVLQGEPRDQITVSFGTGEVQGVFVDEVVCMGGKPQSAQSIDYPRTDATDAFRNELPPDCMRMGMVAATDMTPEPFQHFEFDGVLGLGLSGLSQNNGFNLMDVLGKTVAAGTGRPHTFAVFLANEKEGTSEISFGGWDKHKYDGNLGWSRVVHPTLGHWLVQIQSVRVDDTVIPFCEDGNCRAVVDTGTSLMSVPSKAFAPIYQLLRHIDLDDSGCAGVGPELHFDLVTVSGESFTLSLKPEDYARVDTKLSQGVSPKYLNFGERVAEEPQTHCKASLMSMDMPAPIGPSLFIFGEPMLRKYYTVYDTRSPPKIGFGRVATRPRAESTLQNDFDNDAWFFED